MNKIEPVLLENEFQRAGSEKKIFARLGFPRPLVGAAEWACPFQLVGWKDSRVRVAHGVDGLQALLVAATAIRRSLDRVKLVNQNNEPYEFVFPRVVPISYGIDFHRHLCKILDEEIGKKERQLSRRRLSRRKRS